MNFMEVEMRLSAMEQKMNYLIDAVSRLAEQDSLRIMTVDDIAKMLGMPKPTLYKKKWLLPNFGASAGKMEWTKAEVTAHLARGTEELYREYVALRKEMVSQNLGASD